MAQQLGPSKKELQCMDFIYKNIKIGKKKLANRAICTGNLLVSYKIPCFFNLSATSL